MNCEIPAFESLKLAGRISLFEINENGGLLIVDLGVGDRRLLPGMSAVVTLGSQ